MVEKTPSKGNNPSRRPRSEQKALTSRFKTASATAKSSDNKNDTRSNSSNKKNTTMRKRTSTRTRMTGLIAQRRTEIAQRHKSRWSCWVKC